ncbi:MAG: NUDIX hydrolase [Clostridium sp.]
MRLIDVVQLSSSKFLNMYKLKLITKSGKPKDYFVASRRTIDKLSCKTKKHNICDGVMILPITEEGEIVLLKQFRPAIGDYLYELPAGMVDQGETVEEAAKRELYEETGLACISYEEIIKPSYSSVGISDETTAIVKMKVKGEITNKNIEDDEDIEVFKIKLKDAAEFVRKNNFSIKSAIILTFLKGEHI